MNKDEEQGMSVHVDSVDDESAFGTYIPDFWIRNVNPP